jgi:hypothetical protein
MGWTVRALAGPGVVAGAILCGAPCREAAAQNKIEKINGRLDPTKGPGLWTKFKDKYGEEDKVTNFFTGDTPVPPSGSRISIGRSS